VLVGMVVQRGSGAWGVVVVAAAFVAIATVLVVRAHARRAALLRRERALSDSEAGAAERNAREIGPLP
jgi:hypothetical protein